MLALYNRIADDATHQIASTNGIVIAGDDILDHIGVAVGVYYGDDRNLELVGFGNCYVLLLHIKHEHGIWHFRDHADAAEVALELGKFSLDAKSLFLGHSRELARLAHALVFTHLVDSFADRGEVGESTAQPPLIHIGHTAFLGIGADVFLHLLLSADHEDSAALSHSFAHELVCSLYASHGGFEVENVDARHLAVNEPAHPWVPPASLMPEMHPCIKQLAHSHHRLSAISN